MINSQALLDVFDLKMYFKLKSGLFESPQYLKAVDGVSFAINRGETLGLVGESGCGKTTVGRTILKLYDATGGNILYQGKDLTRIADKDMLPYRKKMQMIFQDPYTSLDPRMTVGKIIEEPLAVHNMFEGNAKEDRIRELLQSVGLKQDHINRYPHEFSGGQRQRIGIARALAAEPEFIVCDEPVSALDVSIQAQVINMLEEFQEKFRLTYLFISHDLSIIRHISHKVGVMYLGHLIEYANVDELFNNMLHPYTKALMSAAPVADPVISKNNNRIILQGDVPSPINPPSGCPFRTRCNYAEDICKKERPTMKKMNENHMVACHLYHK